MGTNETTCKFSSPHNQQYFNYVMVVSRGNLASWKKNIVQLRVIDKLKSCIEYTRL